MTSDQLFPILLAAWVAFCVSGFALFYSSRNLAFKRRFFPWYILVVSVLFLGFLAAMGTGVPLLAMMAPLVALTGYLNLRRTRFCGACGRTVVNLKSFATPEFCSSCGTSLKEAALSGSR